MKRRMTCSRIWSHGWHTTRLAALLVALPIMMPVSAQESRSVREQPAGGPVSFLHDANVRLRAHAPDVEAMFSRARLLADGRQINEAVELYAMLLAQHPDIAEAHNNLGLLQLQLGQLEKAEFSFTEVLRVRPGDAAAHENLGDAHVRMALRAYGAAARLNPDDKGAGEKSRVLLPVLSAKGGVAVDLAAPAIRKMRQQQN